LAPSPAYDKVVEASGGLGLAVEDVRELDSAMTRAIAAVQGGQQALLNVRCTIGA
jgi:acetolactate synthase-1/2/3 large subunit